MSRKFYVVYDPPPVHGDSQYSFLAWFDSFLLTGYTVLTRHFQSAEIMPDNKLWSSSEIKAIHRKEALVLIWRNFTDPSLIWEHIKNYPVLASRKMWGKKVFIKSFIEAVRLFPHVIENWKRNVRYSILADKQLIDLLPAKDLQYS